MYITCTFGCVLRVLLVLAVIYGVSLKSIMLWVKRFAEGQEA
ncbi:MAG: hypothetical protein RML38_05045 [Bacteroidia bacterium]|nr:hypothetical protein [Bacteroidia bacterium]